MEYRTRNMMLKGSRKGICGETAVISCVDPLALV